MAPVASQILQRDRHAEALCALALMASSLDKFATEIRHLQRNEVAELEEPFEASRHGSSSMPHKRNPARSERISGLARVVRANAQVGLENVALWHERDISHSSAERIVLVDSTTLIDYMLFLFAGIMEGLAVYPQKMAQNLDLTRGQIFSQAAMLELVEAGMNRQEAYELVRAQCHAAAETGEHLLSAPDPPSAGGPNTLSRSAWPRYSTSTATCSTSMKPSPAWAFKTMDSTPLGRCK